MKYTVLVIILTLHILGLSAQNRSLKLDVISRTKTLQAIEELRLLMAFPNDATYPDDILKNAEWLEQAFQKRSFATKIIPTENTPLLLAERKTPGAKNSVLFYMHYDGQPVNPAKWLQKSPYIAVLKEKINSGEWAEIPWSYLTKEINPEWRIFGRSSSDDKGPITMFLAAMDALQENKLTVPYNIKVILDGEEEKGSTHLPDAVKKHHELLQADHLLIFDGPTHLSGDPTLVYGCRGMTNVTLTVYGPQTPLHSGHYGNYAPNPVFRLSKLLGSMKDDEGRVTIPGYYDGIFFDDQTKKILAGIPDDPALIAKTFGIAEPEKVGANYQESLQYPSLNVRGFSSGYVGLEVTNIIPASAIASLDLRLVPESQPDRLKELIRKYIGDQGYYVIDREPTAKEFLQYSKICKFESGSASLPFRASFSSLTAQWLDHAFQNGLGATPLKIRTMGGTLPMVDFINILNVPTIIVPLVNGDNNQHSENENLKIGNVTSGIKTILAILTEEIR